MGGIFIFIAITHHKQLTRDDLQHFKHIEEAIDGLLFRTSMNNEENKDMIQSLLQLGFSKDKIIIHSDTTLLEELNLKRIHFKSNDTTAFAYKAAHPDIYVSMSTHDVETVKRCYENNLDYVFLGHIFPTASHPDTPPRSKKTIQQALDVPIPIYAIGGINEHSIYKMPPGFKGICAISYFNNASLEEIKQLRKEWSTHA
ncbi:MULTISPECIES: thiamine phosphate synthase [Staphylococcus]|uniref:thiamine phosphate synthase n=1 Tax=Staphylococcus TaxID=1279 RepID=UPI00094A7360|nr:MULTISPECIES: thiamine phosphate synthase [Staphylococcus]APT15508.1 thiamine phosphate synthase [Staphylococcus epidermidis]AYY61459.1 thiamine phosphate synthase [Staphylococcus epidermidis]KAB2227123.1 thiamine phosphate synthase [Staphylococcus epidermidis]MBE7346257.1 thiamine phosphate synthase [Staphylococcus epidermidis]MBF2225282.1 thiamine phosphate synthase [Staphylococcus epidermidis]